MLRTHAAPDRPTLRPSRITRVALVGVLGAVAAAAAGCTGPAPEPQPTFSDLLSALDTDLADAERTCLEQQCDQADSAEALATCRTTTCAERPDMWSVVPTAIRYEGETAFVQARLSYEPGGYGPIDVPRTQEAYVGCTLVTSQGQEIDLAVTTVFPGDLERPFTLSSDVGPDVQDAIFGVWDRKIEPCDSERMGCREYGFLLDGSLATWPPTVYDDGTRQRIPPSTVDVTILDAGVGARFPELKDKTIAALNQELAVFGSSVGQVSTGLAPSARARSLVGFRHDHDQHLARLVSTTLATFGTTAESQRDRQAQTPFHVVLAGDAATYEKASESCGNVQDAAYDTCAASL